MFSGSKKKLNFIFVFLGPDRRSQFCSGVLLIKAVAMRPRNELLNEVGLVDSSVLQELTGKKLVDVSAL